MKIDVPYKTIARVYELVEERIASYETDIECNERAIKEALENNETVSDWRVEDNKRCQQRIKELNKFLEAVENL